MLENLSQRLSKIVKHLKGQTRLTDENTQEMLREVRLALLEADVALPVIRSFIESVKVKALGQAVAQSLTPGQALVGLFHQELTSLLGGDQSPLNLAVSPPAVVLMAGLQGAGKTTTVGKLAHFLIAKEKKKVLTVSCDVYRFAAIEQLRTVAEQAGASFFPSQTHQNPIDIAEKALSWAQTHYYDVLLVDTAGRLAIDNEMMSEINALHEKLHPVETLFVLDAMQGQDAVQTAKAFREVVPLTGVVLTKLDGDARGGAALSVKAGAGIPIKLVGVGEKIGALEVFHPERMAQRILGMGDIVSLVEEANQMLEQGDAKALSDKIKAGNRFDLNDFASQLKQMRQMSQTGGLASLFGKLPLELQQVAARQGSGEDADKKIRRMLGIVHSMTPAERRKPDLIRANHRRRIAHGAGVDVRQVNQLLTQFKQMESLVRQVQKGGMGKVMRGIKGLLSAK